MNGNTAQTFADQGVDYPDTLQSMLKYFNNKNLYIVESAENEIKELQSGMCLLRMSVA